jgi:hypothetical protein
MELVRIRSIPTPELLTALDNTNPRLSNFCPSICLMAFIYDWPLGVPAPSRTSMEFIRCAIPGAAQRHLILTRNQAIARQEQADALAPLKLLRLRSCHELQLRPVPRGIYSDAASRGFGSAPYAEPLRHTILDRRGHPQSQ